MCACVWGGGGGVEGTFSGGGCACWQSRLFTLLFLFARTPSPIVLGALSTPGPGRVHWRASVQPARR